MTPNAPSPWLIFHFERNEQGAIRLADAPVNKFSSFPIHSLEGAIKYIKCRTSIGCGPLTCVCEHRDGKLRIAWTEDKGMERSS
jgi:hypothetical protein